MDVKGIKQAVVITEIILAVFLVAVMLFNSFYTVSEQQQAVITQFGKVVGTQEAGLHFKVPFVQDVTLVEMSTKGMEFGYRADNSAIESESFMITKDFNFVNVDFFVEYKVSSPVKFLYNSQDPVGLMRNILQAEARSVVSSYNVDEVLTTAKVEIQSRVKEGVTRKIDTYDLGIMVTNISIQDANPPTAEVTAAFKDVENAKQNKDTQINEANKYLNEIIPQAVAEADKIIKDAEGVKESRINEARGQAARFNELYTEYALNKDITKTRMYLEAMEQILPNVNVIISESGGSDVLKILDLTDDVSNETEGGGTYEAE